MIVKDFLFGMIGGLLGLTGAFAANAAATRHENPVLLIHGIMDSEKSMRVMGKWLVRQGWEVHFLSLVPNNGSVPLDELAKQIARFVKETFPAGQKIDLVGFSMGGIVCRYYLQSLGGADHVERFVQISSPNHGTAMASFVGNPACVQMRRNSRFLARLNADLSVLKKVELTTIWTPFDLIIVPASSSKMPIGRNVRRWALLHPLMILQPSTFRVVAEALSGGNDTAAEPGLVIGIAGGK